LLTAIEVTGFGPPVTSVISRIMAHVNSEARPARRRAQPVSLEPVPNPEGRRLMETGNFGASDRRNGKILRAKRVARRVLERELGALYHGKERAEMPLLKQGLIPESKADMIIQYEQPCYSGQFSADGNFFFCCSKDLKVRMYDTSSPYHWKYYKTVTSSHESWAITDATLSNDNRFLAYCSMTHIICLASTDPLTDSTPHMLDMTRLSPSASRGRNHHSNYCSLFSARFSGDGRELVAGSGHDEVPSVYVFDVEANRAILRIPAHGDDVNSVCFGDAMSPHIIYSGSDDCSVKVWDRRSLAHGRPAGVLLGHVEGVTFVDSKGDGRYILSNGKDQTAKLWDLRKVISPEIAGGIETRRYSQGWDYRYGGYDRSQWRRHPNDCSLVTFRGHTVERTLIRCHFSPEGSTDGRYVYSGSHDGSVFIWNMDAQIKAKIAVDSPVNHARRKDPRDHSYLEPRRDSRILRQIVRDCSWHPSIPMIAGS
jgi:WD repeat-containing protein 23